jgi:hypothetical protein
MQGVMRAASGGKQRPGQEQVFLLPPEMADVIQRSGWGLAEVQRFLFASDPSIASDAAAIHPVITGGAGVKMTHPALWMGGTATVTKPLLRP